MDQYFSILELHPGASDAEIKRAYRRLARRYHPDVNPSPDAQQKFLEIAEAYEYLIEKPYLKGWDEFVNTTAAEPVDPRVTREAERKERARQYAEKQRMQFRSEVEAFQRKWYFIPVKLIAYLFIGAAYLLGVAMLISPFWAWFSARNPGLTVALGLLAVASSQAFALAMQVQKKVAPYFRRISNF